MHMRSMSAAMAENRLHEQGLCTTITPNERTPMMPEITSSALHVDDRSVCDLVIETFDQWHGSSDLWLNTSRVSFVISPADQSDSV
jgi:hypothetical protein